MELSFIDDDNPGLPINGGSQDNLRMQNMVCWGHVIKAMGGHAAALGAELGYLAE